MKRLTVGALLALLALQSGAQSIVGDWPDLSRYVVVIHDNEAINTVLYRTNSGAGATVNTVSMPDGIGQNSLQVTTGTTTTGRAQIVVDGVGFNPGIGVSFATAIGVYFEDLSDGTEAYTAWSGFTDSATDSGVDAAACRYSHTINAGEWECYTRQDFGGAGGESTCDTNVTVVADTRFTISVALQTDSAKFAINGVPVCSITANVPSGASRLTAAVPLQLVKSAGTTARLAYLDAYQLIQVLNSPRN